MTIWIPETIEYQIFQSSVFKWSVFVLCSIYANLVILATPVRIISYQVVSLGHLGGFVAF